MRTIEEMLRQLLRADVTEFAVVTDRLPCVKVGSTFQPVDEDAPNTDVILQMLVSAGGSRYVDALGETPVTWSMRLEGVGQISVKALMRDEIVQARFKLTRRDPRAEEPESLAPEALIEDDEVRSIRPRAPGLSAPPMPTGGGFLEHQPFDLESSPDVQAPSSGVPDLAFGGLSHKPLFEPQAPELEARAPLFGGSALQLDVPVPELETPMPVLEAPRPVLEAPVRAKSRANIRPVSGMPDLLMLARISNASDLHIVPDRPPLFRIAGELRASGGVLEGPLVDKIVRETVPERLHPQLEREGSCDFAMHDADGRSRVNVVKQRTGYKITIRLIPPEVPTLASLGLTEQIGHATHHHQGLIVVTGPTGHGKTATLAAIVNLINTETTHHVITVEDPVEYLHPRKRALMSQREVGTHTKSFAAALKGSLREDPDVIVVGELRDTETVRMALSASETGHLVISTMNTPSAAKTIDRLIDLFPPGDQAQVRLTLAGGLRLIVSQRLIPNADRTGLVAAAEILPGSVSLWSLIRDNKTYQIPSLQQRGKGIGITRFDDSLVDLVKAGRTSLEIAKEWAESPEDVEMDALGKRPVAQAFPHAQPQMKTGENAAKPGMGGLFDKAGSLFRKG